MYNFLRTLGNSSYESPRGEDSESPLKSYKMFPYAQVIGRWKKYFFLESSRRRFFLNAIIQPVGRTSSRGNTACRFVCSSHWDATFVAFYSSGQNEGRRFQIWQRTNIFHGNEIPQRRSMCVNANFWTGASRDHLVGVHQRTILTGQSHITKVAPVIEMQQRGDSCRFLQFRSKWK